MNWLEKTSIVLPISNVPKDLKGAFNLYIDKYNWVVSRTGQLSTIYKSLWTIQFSAYDKLQTSELEYPQYIVYVHMKWNKKLEEKYNTEVGAQGLDLTVQVAKVIDEEITDLSDRETFETSLEVALFVKNAIEGDNGDNDQDDTEDFSPQFDPEEVVPEFEPSLVLTGK